MDDFGSGRSALNGLNVLHFDVVKLLLDDVVIVDICNMFIKFNCYNILYEIIIVYYQNKYYLSN